MQNMSNGWIDQREMQRLQEEFCKALGVCACCLDVEGKKVTEISGTARQIEKVQEYMELPQVSQVLERVEEGSLEDQAVEELGYDGDRVAAIAVRVNGATLVYWLVFFMSDEKMSEETLFLHVVDLLRDASYTLFSNKFSSYSAEVESKRSRFAEQEMSKHLHTIEATAEIVQLLDSDERAEGLMQRWLDILSQHLQVDTAQLYQTFRESDTMDVICEYLAPKHMSIYDRIGKLSIPRLLRTENPMIISSDTTDADLRQYLKEWKLQALIQLPVIRQEGSGALILSLNFRKRHIWDMQEIKFAGDAVRVLQNILTRRIQKNSIASSYRALEMVLDNVGCAVYVKDRKTDRVLLANGRLKSEFDAELKEDTFDALLRRSIEQGQDSGFYEIHHIRGDRWYDLSFTEISWVDGRQAMLYSLYDTTERKIYQKRIEQQAYTDFLTGLYNRMCCERDLARQVDKAKKNGSKGALLYLDLDDFKHINDGLGHQYGDALLKAISHSMQRIQGIENTCYRMGGDEFVVLVPPEQYEDFDRILEQIREIFVKPWFLKDADYYCTMSMGSVTFPDMGESVADLIKKADIAMYEAKKGGKNQYVSYKEGLNAASGRRLDMERNMRDATVEGYEEFEVYYQPIIDVQNGAQCAGAEALIRWNSSKLGFIPPTEFIPLAEYLGLINPIGNYVLQEACRQCREWNESGHPDYKVNVNLSVVQLLQPDVVDMVEKTLTETGILPRNLTLEVTESLAINDMDRMQDILNRIKALGVKIALDDFGTGYSSLSHIREIPFDLIKVDQSFAKDLAKDAYSRSFIKMVTELAGTLGVNICVEGIETEAQYNVVKSMNVKYIQGYYFDRPMKRQDFAEKYVACDAQTGGLS